MSAHLHRPWRQEAGHAMPRQAHALRIHGIRDELQCSEGGEHSQPAPYCVVKSQLSMIARTDPLLVTLGLTNAPGPREYVAENVI